MRAIGKYFLFIGSMFSKMESFQTYAKRFIDECVQIGLNSIVIVSIVSIFIGAVTTIQTAYNLVSPLIADYIISVVVRDMTILELAPSITAVVFAGKVGSNIAGELGTMRITEQIDALEVMGINSASFLVLPKIMATLVMYPLLVILAGFLSIYGGYWAGVTSGIISAQDYIYGIQYELIEFTVVFAMIKSFVFAFLIASISSYKGYYTQGGALEVGKASTSAVTNSVIAVLGADYLLAELFLN